MSTDNELRTLAKELRTVVRETKNRRQGMQAMTDRVFDISIALDRIADEQSDGDRQ